MPDTTLLGLPLLEAAQAQKHVTHNEALDRLDALVHLSVISRALASPPAAPAEGDRYLVPASSSGDWGGHAGKLAYRTGSIWRFAVPKAGWRLWVQGENLLLVFDGAAWQQPGSAAPLQNLPHLGINTTADATNKLAVASANVLLTHVGSDARLKLNKDAAADTASLVYQAGFSGRAELGLAGDDDFHLKVSPDGSAWTEALVVSRDTGRVTLAANSVANASLADMPAATLKGRASAGSGDPEDLTPAEATAMLDVFTPMLKGLVPASGGGTKFLRADGAWAGPDHDVSRGSRALSLVPSALLGRKFAILDLVGGGYAADAEQGPACLSCIENLAGIEIATPANARRITANRGFENLPANQLRFQHGLDGLPKGVLFEAAHDYLNGKTQPLVAETTAFNIADAAAPAGHSGNWTYFGDDAVRRYRVNTVNVITGQPYWVAFLVQMEDGSAPATGGASNGAGWDFYPYLFSGANGRNPDTGEPGARISGPLQGNVYLVEAYAEATFTAACSIGCDKLGNSARPFKVGPMCMGTGRYPPSLFDNATSTPNRRAGDALTLPLAGFSTGQLTILGEFAMPLDATGIRTLFAPAGASASGCSLRFDAGSNSARVVAQESGAASFDAATSPLTPGASYRFAVAFDCLGRQVRSKFTGLSAIATAAPSLGNVAAGPLAIGHQDGTQQLGNTIKSIAVAGRAWTAAEMAGWTG